MTRDRIVQRIRDEGAVAVLRMKDAEGMLHVAQALLDGGLSVLEVTMTTPGALDHIRMLADTFGDRVLVGVGSVLDGGGANRAIEAGARFVVSPVLKPEVIEAGHRHGLPVMPGAFTPTEAQRAHELGADVIKIFPANVVGMAFFKSVLAPLPHLRLMPTGGVTLDNAGDWIRAGACAVGVGGALLDKAAIARGDYAVLTANAHTLRRSLSGA